MAEHKDPKDPKDPKAPAYTTVHTATPAPAPKAATTPRQPQPTYQDKKVIFSRPSRAGDPGYQLSTVYDQVTITLEDGTELVVKSSDLTPPDELTPLA